MARPRRASSARLAMLSCCVAAGTWASESRAEAPVSRAGVYSKYEQQTIAQVLSARGARVDARPEGKIVESIEVEVLEVFEPRDPAPQALNALHATTRPYVIRREVLLDEGEPYRGVLADETARNVRQLGPVSLALVVPIAGSTPDRVRVLVIAKDVWSLRLNWDASVSSGGLESLTLQPTEANVLGLQHSASLQAAVLPASAALSARYLVPRVAGTRVAAGAEVGVIVNRETGGVEGSIGSVSVARPLFSTLTPWAAAASASWRHEVARRYTQARVARFDARATPQRDDIAFVYRSEREGAAVAATRSYGWRSKNDLTAGFEANRRVFRAFDLSAYEPAAADEFVRRAVPTSDTRVGPYVQWRTYRTDFVRVLDLETLGLQEDFRLGHDAYVRVYPVSTALGSSRTFVGVFAGAQYTVPLGDGLARAVVESTTETQPQAGWALPDASIEASLRLVTPRFFAGRVVFDATVLDRYRNYLNRTSFLGGDGRLRGFPTGFAVGSDVFTYNLEYRTRPLQIASLQLGGVVFHDVGDAVDGLASLRPKQAVGAGVRALFPQFDRVVLRLDVAAPLSAGRLPSGVAPVSYFFSFGQAFSVPVVGP